MSYPERTFGKDSYSLWRVTLICVALFLMVFLVFGQSIHYGFSKLDDDDQNIVGEIHVTSGLSLKNAAWAFSHCEVDRWIPASIISHQIDCQLFGLWAAGHHLVSLLLHAFASVVLLFALRSLTGALWRSACVAGLFAIHPLKVEPVVWISARNELLCGLFFLLAIWAYAHYVRRPKIRRYLLVALFFTLGLVSKPMIITLPLVLLLLDYWPLQRMQRAGTIRDWHPLIIEKLPLLLLSVVFAFLTVYFQDTSGTPIWECPPLFVRFVEIPVVYCFYLVKEVFPYGLAIYYSFFNKQPPAALDLGCLFILLTFTWGAFYWGIRSSRPYMITCWLWFLVMLLPVLDLAGIYCFTPADRYAYLPMIGLSVVVVWSLSDWFSKKGMPGICRWSVCVACGLIFLGLMILSVRQTEIWSSNISLWTHDLECTTENALGEFKMGNLQWERGNSLEALNSYRRAADTYPYYNNAHFLSGLALRRLGRLDEAISEYRSGLKKTPWDLIARDQLADTLVLQGQPQEAVLEYKQALKIDPTSIKVASKLVRLLISSGKRPEALEVLENTLRMNPNAVSVQNDLAWILATAPENYLLNGKRALELALQANKATEGKDPSQLDTLAACYAETGAYPEALRTANRARELAKQAGMRELTETLDKEIGLYESGKPIRDPQ